uniref:Baculoviral IAP repeat-containing protein 5-like n=1 Tax=Saccoglossus kowalevskii TaxID=10224 RepID=A0ABM0GMN4_SACKO|nr:PREDICTED: baculoviral IAP repeat-containing protein 5-like [Saccoglossus kowalevskii]
MEKTSDKTCDTVEQMPDFSMNMEASRLASFKEWPFDSDCQCTPKKMAAAGFFHCPTDQEPDLAKCFMCFKELDGWEPDDDPWEEHLSHSGQCPFLSKKKKEDDLTMAEFLKLESSRQTNRLMKIVETKIKEFKQQATTVREQLELLA